MIKRMLLINCLLVLVPCVCFGSTNPYILGIHAVADGSDCPSWTSSTIVAWDGDHGSGTNYICTTSESTIVGTNTNLTISTSYGESSSNGSFHDTRDERLTWSQTAGQYADETGTQTLWMRVYITGDPSVDTLIWESAYDGSNFINFKIRAGLQGQGVYSGTTLGAATANCPAIATGEWVDVAYSWDRPSENHSAYNGVSWNDNNGELTLAMDNSPTLFSLGNDIVYMDSTPSTESVRVTQWAIVSGYKTSAPW